MKKVIIILILIAFAQTSMAQVTDQNGKSAASADGTTLSGKIGIGVSNPTVQLEVLGDGKFVGNSPTLNIEGTGSGNYNGGKISLKAGGIDASTNFSTTLFSTHRDTDGEGIFTIQRRNLNNDYLGALLRYKDSDGWIMYGASSPTSGGTVKRFEITSLGNVGIGLGSSNTPVEKLQIGDSGFAFHDGGHKVIQIDPEDDNGGEIRFQPNEGILSLGIRDNGQMSTHFRVDNTGNVVVFDRLGVGVTEPKEKIHVNGGIRLAKSKFNTVSSSAGNGWVRDTWMTSNGVDIRWDEEAGLWKRNASTYNDFGGVIWQDEGTYFIKEPKGTKLDYTNQEFLSQSFMFADAFTGNIGIGLNTPTNGKLVVKQTQGNDVKSGIALKAKTSNQSSYFWMDEDDVMHIDNSVVASRNIILNGNGGGKVGIGVNKPLAKLHVFGSEGEGIYDTYATSIMEGKDARLQILSADHGNQGSAISLTNKNSSWTMHQKSSSSDFRLDIGHRMSEGNEDIAEKQDVHMSITTKGKVGVGTVNPYDKLQVNDGLNMKISMGAFNTGANPNSSEEPHILLNRWLGSGNKYVTNGIEVLKDAGGGNDYGLAFTRTEPHEQGDYSDSKISMFIQNSSGNVGIGTINPDAKLAVKGQIHTQEVKVDLNGAVAPDYVFESDYDLITLEAIEEYIKLNKHLPEIPSAKEMEQNGMKLKEMNFLLLKKVEELTLYTIEQEKKIKEQKAINSLIIKRLEKLESVKKD